MSEVFLTVVQSPLFPKAGDRFKVTVKLNAAAKENLTIVFEKHRVQVDGSGTHALCPILEGYFTNDGYPRPIELKKGKRAGTNTVQVSARAMNPPCPPPEGGGRPGPVLFPDRLMLTAFVTRSADPAGPLVGKAHVVVTIVPASPKK